MGKGDREAVERVLAGMGYVEQAVKGVPPWRRGN